MPRRPAQAPKYRHYRPKDLAVVRIDGRDHYLGRHGSPESWERYHRILAERAISGRVVPPPHPSAAGPPPTDVTVSEVILAFWKHAQGHYRHPDGTPSEELGNIKAALRPVRQLYGLTPAKDFGPLALQAVRDEMARSGLARTSINDRVNRVRRAFRWAASVELVPVAVVQALATVSGLQKGRTTAREPEPVGPVPIEDVEATLPFLSRPVAGLVRLQLLTGMRPGEACAMRGRDLTRGEGLWLYKPGSHKTAWRGKRREIPLGPRAMELVLGFMKGDPEAFLFSPAEAVAEHHASRSARRKTKPTPSERARRAPSPGSGRAGRYRRNTYLGAVNRACDRAFPHPTLSAIKPSQRTEAERGELELWRKAHRWHPNQLRHSAATTVRATFGLEAAQVVLGHARADTTEIYAERDLSKAAEVMRNIG
jgi:integrase